MGPKQIYVILFILYVYMHIHTCACVLDMHVYLGVHVCVSIALGVHRLTSDVVPLELSTLFY